MDGFRKPRSLSNSSSSSESSSLDRSSRGIRVRKQGVYEMENPIRSSDSATNIINNLKGIFFPSLLPLWLL